MITIRKAQERGHAYYRWLNTYHTFSFANYYDPNHMGFRSLRVINEDKIIGGAGFPTHGHRDMEIITYVLEGELEHKDSIGNGSIIKAGEIQRMSAGTGILHSEYNHSKTNLGHFLQIWIVPNQKGLQPSYQQETLDLDKTPGQLQLIAAPDETKGIITIHQDVLLYAGNLKQGNNLTYYLSQSRHVWLQIVRGKIALNDIILDTSDGAAISQEPDLLIEAKTDSEVLLFDLA
ncbi:Pirin domain protein [Gloeothece citriformis PCC 7424]|uniref:Pirin domain protein n=1 Tax=Gloeothece citriformis (strain PCC 7424) TaxID=65393 RepID=B7KII2_GLOC7|nr:pirin family protein [Gloeothece citriformis]ACK69388.1 Pirin domain protein [Gloeothece citriformis PCC 7424]